MRLSVSIVLGISLLLGVGICGYTTVHVSQNFDIGKHVFCLLFVESLLSTLILMTLTVAHGLYISSVWFMIPCYMWLIVVTAGLLLPPFLTAIISTVRYVMLRKGAVNKVPTNKNILTICFPVLIGYMAYICIGLTYSVHQFPPMMSDICGQLNVTAIFPKVDNDLWTTIGSNWQQFLFVVPGLLSLVTSLSFDWMTKKYMNQSVQPETPPAADNDMPLQAGNQQGYDDTIPTRATVLSALLIIPLCICVVIINFIGPELNFLSYTASISFHAPLTAFLAFRVKKEGNVQNNIPINHLVIPHGLNYYDREDQQSQNMSV